MDVREQITALREQLRYHNEKYYNDQEEVDALSIMQLIIRRRIGMLWIL